MKIISIKVMRGPNYWSNYRKNIIVMKLDIGELEQYPTNKIEGFSARLEKLIPSMYTHRCSESHDGGFFERVKEGTWMGHVIEHIALEIQTLAGMDVGYGRTRSDKKEGVYNVVFSYILERAGLYAAKAAIRVAEALIEGKEYNITEDIEALKKIKASDAFGPSTQSIIDEAVKKGIPYKRLNNSSFVLLGHGIHQKKIRATMTSNTSAMGVEMACDKNETKETLRCAHIPTPASVLIENKKELNEAIKDIGYPIVIKPINGNHGRGITTNIRSLEEAKTAFAIAKEISDEILVEKFVEGYDFRFLLINFKLVAVAKRTPAMVTGNGKMTIQQLIDETNKDPNRGDGHEKILTKIKVDKITQEILVKKNYTLDSVLEKDETLFLKDTANISTGGTSTDVTDRVHPANIIMAERIARLLNLDICGIDIVANSVETPITEKNGGVLEVNACPGFRMHLFPSHGNPVNVAKHVVDMLYPKGSEFRIPVVAVTGTNGKTTTTRLIAHLAKEAGHKVGYTTTDGIYIQDQIIHYGDCTGPNSSQTILHDPMVDFAVLECARGGILRSGLGFDNCDISVITNISEDHLSLDGIDSIREMAIVKSVVAHSTFKHGYSILNADDDTVYEISRDLHCNIALFSVEENNPRIMEHCEKGGIAISIENDFIVIHSGQTKIPVEKINDVPLSFDGRAGFMIKNILPAVLAAYLKNVSINTIRMGLRTFIPSPKFTPGRMNIFNFRNFDVMIDYAHNSGGLMELKKFMDKTSAPHKVGIIAAVGDRREEDIRNIGAFSAQMFDELIIRHDEDLRGRTREELNELLIEGIKKQNPDIPIKIISDEQDAITHAMQNAKQGAFITVFTDSVMESIEFLTTAQQKEEMQYSTSPKQILLKAS
ncbi:MAG: cyanophycin synthetase [Bacteroidetes bacterium]|jgi:cyanophycin synthetase|nr:cyanophycin synthetase [Bacteroidota bacterium]